jgi:hypothetical protein
MSKICTMRKVPFTCGYHITWYRGGLGSPNLPTCTCVGVKHIYAYSIPCICFQCAACSPCVTKVSVGVTCDLRLREPCVLRLGVMCDLRLGVCD